MRRSKTNCVVRSAPAMGLPRRVLLLASVLLALSSSGGATSLDTVPMPVVLPIGARQSVASSSVVASRRRLFALGDGAAANFSLPLEGAIKDYGCVRDNSSWREEARGKKARAFFLSPSLSLFSISFSHPLHLSTSSTSTATSPPHSSWARPQNPSPSSSTRARR
jgi:hypothetical protein